MVNRGSIKVIVKGKTIASFTDSDKKDTTCEKEVEKVENQLLKDARIKLYASTSHYEDFLSCVASRKKPVASEQIGGRTVICCHLMNQLYFNNAELNGILLNSVLQEEQVILPGLQATTGIGRKQNSLKF